MSQARENYSLSLPRGTDLGSLVTSLNFIFQRIAQRLDQLEGLRGTPTFYKDVFNFITDAGLTSGNVMRATSVSQVEMGSVGVGDIDGILTLAQGGLGADVSAYDGLVKISAGAASAVSLWMGAEDLLDGLINIYDEHDTLVHQYSIENLSYTSEVQGFIR